MTNKNNLKPIESDDLVKLVTGGSTAWPFPPKSKSEVREDPLPEPVLIKKGG